MKKRIVALTLVSLMVLSLAGCTKIKNAYELADYSANVEIGTYTGLEIEVNKVEITDEQVQAQVDSIIKAGAKTEQITEGEVAAGDTINWTYSGTLSEEAVEARKQAILESAAEHYQITDRTVQDGDTINLDFAGHYINEDGSKGDAFDGGTATDYTYTIGGGFITDLNDQLIGLETGKEYDLECTFPENYSSADLAGVKVIFTVTVNYIEGDIDTSTIPEWTDDFVNGYSAGSYTTTEAMETYIREMGTTEGASFTANGSNADGFNNELENQIIGSTVGKEYTVTVNFPENYSTFPEIAGMEATVVFTVNYIAGETTYPEWNDEYVTTYSENAYTTTEAYEAHIREDLETTALAEQKETYEATLWAQIVDGSTIVSYPEDALQTNYERFYNSYKSTFEYYASMYSTTYEEFLASYGAVYWGISSDEELQTACMDYAKNWLDYAMIAVEISKKENIVVPIEEFTAEEESLVASGNYDTVTALEEAVTTDYLMEYFIYQKVTDWLGEHNKMVETEVESGSAVDESATAAGESTTAAETTTSAQ